jgi:hypothetical protein
MIRELNGDELKQVGGGGSHGCINLPNSGRQLGPIVEFPPPKEPEVPPLPGIFPGLA